MAYIGAEPLPGQNREVDDISSSFNGSTTAFTLQVNGLNVSPETANNILVNIGGVIQNPGTDYTIAASTITFTTAPASGLSFFAIILGAGINTATVADDTIGASKLIDTAVTAGSYTTADITVDAQGRITAAASGNISSAEIADNAVTTAKINADAVTSAKIADNAVVTAAINADAVTGAKIADDSINSEHYVDGSIDTAHIADSQITSAKIADDNVTQAKIAAGAVSTTELSNSGVTTSKLADDAVTSAKLGAGAVDTTALGADAVTAAKIADDAVNSTHLDTNAVTTDSLGATVVTTAKIADDAVTAAKLANTSVSAGSYGSATAIPAFTVDAQGRLTAASTNALSAGGLTLLSTTTLSSSGTTAANVSINTSGYTYIRGEIIGITRASGSLSDIRLRWNGSSGTSFYRYIMNRMDNNGSVSFIGVNGVNATDSGFPYNMIGVAGYDSGVNRAVFELYLVNDGVPKPFNMLHTGEQSSGGVVLHTRGYYNSNSAITSLEIATVDTNINGGTLKLYGVK